MKTITILSVLFLSVYCSAQNDSIVTNHYNSQPYETNFNEDAPYIKIGVGWYLPQGELSTYFNPSPAFEFDLEWMNSEETRAAELLFQFMLPDQRRPFVYQTDVADYTATSSLIMNALLRLSKVINTGASSDMKLGAGIGISSIFLEANQLEFVDQLKETNSNSILFNVGLSYNSYFKDRSILSIGIDFNFTQYTIEGSVDQSIGGIALIPKIAYRF